VHLLLAVKSFYGKEDAYSKIAKQFRGDVNKPPEDLRGEYDLL